MRSTMISSIQCTWTAAGWHSYDSFPTSDFHGPGDKRNPNPNCASKGYFEQELLRLHATSNASMEWVLARTVYGLSPPVQLGRWPSTASLAWRSCSGDPRGEACDGATPLSRADAAIAWRIVARLFTHCKENDSTLVATATETSVFLWCKLMELCGEDVARRAREERAKRGDTGQTGQQMMLVWKDPEIPNCLVQQPPGPPRHEPLSDLSKNIATLALTTTAANGQAFPKSNPKRKVTARIFIVMDNKDRDFRWIRTADRPKYTFNDVKSAIAKKWRKTALGESPEITVGPLKPTHAIGAMLGASHHNVFLPGYAMTKTFTIEEADYGTEFLGWWVTGDDWTDNSEQVTMLGVLHSD
ncbi:hypothetical protein DFH27DRAFT_527996 [Peziza echinospora]|nr:hypothetical protein DFH27DRAFT_527996 [Peziza echinospora]